jgi:hypothetical protein
MHRGFFGCATTIRIETSAIDLGNASAEESPCQMYFYMFPQIQRGSNH